MNNTSTCSHHEDEWVGAVGPEVSLCLGVKGVGESFDVFPGKP